MSIPIATTRIAVRRIVVPQDTDSYDDSPPAPRLISDGVRAVIDTPSASTTLAGGARDVYEAGLECDVCDLQEEDQVTDSSGTTWILLWARRVTGLGIDYMQGRVRLVSGTGG